MTRSNGVVGVPSVRTYSYDVICGAPGKLPESFMLSGDRLPKVTNQGSINACCAFAAAEILFVLNHMEFNAEDTFSEGFIYGHNREPQAAYEGMNPDNLMKHLCKYGSVPKKYYSELYEMPEMQKKLASNPNLKQLEAIAEKYKLSGFVGFLNGNKEAMKQALYEAQYPLFAISSNYFGGSHAIIIVGWNKDGFIIQNSWGDDWGKDGRDTVPLSAVNYAYMFIDEVLKMGFEDVKETDWFYDAVKECVFNGLMRGVSDTEFAPQKPLTRAEAAQLMSNLMKKIDEVNRLK